MKYIVLVLVVLLANTVVGCGESYTKEDINSAYSKGYDEGYGKGYDAGLTQPRITPTPSLTTNIDVPSFSADEVRALVGNHVSDMSYGNFDLQSDASSGWKTSYLGDGKWEVQCILKNTIGIWYFYEKNQTIQFWGNKVK